MNKKHIVCFGDSNTHGYDGDTGARFDEDERWTCLLGKLLGDKYLVLEEGLGGRTTCFTDPLHEGMNGLDVIYPCLMSHEPVDLLIIMLGTNDTKERFGASPEAIGICMQRLIKKAKSTECWRSEPNILVVTPKNIGREYFDPPMGKGCDIKSEGLSKAFEQACKVTSVHYFDANTVVTSNNKTDHMHLNKQGHQELADALYKIVKELA